MIKTVRYNEATGVWWFYDEAGEPVKCTEFSNLDVSMILEKGLKYDELLEKYNLLLKQMEKKDG